MRRRKPEVPDAALMFHGRRYGTVAEREAAAETWRERRRRLLRLITAGGFGNQGAA